MLSSLQQNCGTMEQVLQDSRNLRCHFLTHRVEQKGFSEMAYEDGMQLVFDDVERTLVVSFREIIKLLGPFESQKAAVLAGEQYCRDLGWVDNDDPFPHLRK